MSSNIITALKPMGIGSPVSTQIASLFSWSVLGDVLDAPYVAVAITAIPSIAAE